MYTFKIIEYSGDETIKIKCFSNNIYCGHILFEKIIYMDEYFLSEEEREEIGYEIMDYFFPDDNCIYIKFFEVDINFQNLGIGNLLMNKFFEYFNNQKEINSIFINACPYLTSTINNKIPLNILVKFYKKFGFQELLNQETNILMAYKNKKR